MYLLDCYSPVFCQVLEIIQNDEEYSDTLRENILTVLAQAEYDAREKGYDGKEIEEAHFATQVWVDEMLLSAGAEWLRFWRPASLQHIHYNSALGGHTFFERLSRLPASGYQARLVYLFCLLCGFHGHFDCQDDSEIQKIIQQQTEYLPENIQIWMTQNAPGLMLSAPQPKITSKYPVTRMLLYGGGGMIVAAYYFLSAMWLIHMSS